MRKPWQDTQRKVHRMEDPYNWRRHGVTRAVGWSVFAVVSVCALYILSDRSMGFWAAMGEALPLLFLAFAWLLVLLVDAR